MVQSVPCRLILCHINLKHTTMKHFTIEELTRSITAQRLGIVNTPPPKAVKNLHRLVEQVLDPLREAWGGPIHVNSGYRCPELNRAVGGAPHSQHMKGEAADITVGTRLDNARLYHLLMQLQLPVDQAINERDFAWIHVSYGPRHRRQYLALR